MARIGIFGGTFDPIHNGHIVAAEQALAALELDQILFVPTANNWQKDTQTSALHRCAMVALAISSNPKFALNLVDIDRGGVTYSIDTLRDIKSAHHSDDLFFLLGADAASSIPSWQECEGLGRYAEFVVLTRPGFKFVKPSGLGIRFTQLEIEALDISSTACRAAIKSGASLDQLVPKAVAEYISRSRIYEVGF